MKLSISIVLLLSSSFRWNNVPDDDVFDGDDDVFDGDDDEEEEEADDEISISMRRITSCE